MDAFSKLGVPKRLVIDEAELDTRFRELSKSAHPDMGGDSADFEALRKAYEELKSPASRLRIAVGEENARGSVPGKIMDLFGPVAEVIQEVEGFLGERAAARSGLGRAVLDAKMPALKEKTEGTMSQLTKLEEELVGRFGEFDQEGWNQCQEEMGEVARGLAFVTKWQAQLRMAVGKLFEALLGG